jgi:hypothetical protein
MEKTMPIPREIICLDRGEDGTLIALGGEDWRMSAVDAVRQYQGGWFTFYINWQGKVIPVEPVEESPGKWCMRSGEDNTTEGNLQALPDCPELPDRSWNKRR